MNHLTNNADLIRNEATVTVRWTEATCEPRENVEMSQREFRGLLAEIRDEFIAEYGATAKCYTKVAFLAGGKSFRIDVNGATESMDLKSAWLY